MEIPLEEDRLPPPKMNAAELMVLVQGRFSQPEWALFPQVRDAAGFSASRTMDALAVSLWPSRGLEWHGIELKVSRADWVRELRNPAKAEGFCTQCDRWWVVVSDRRIVHNGELPPTWGLLAPHGKGLRAFVEAPLMGARGPLDRSFVAAVMRRASQVVVTPAAARAELDRAFERGMQEGKIEAGYNRDGLMRQHELLERSVREFEERSGVRINDWDGGKIGDAVRVVMRGDVEAQQRRLRNLRASAAAVVEALDMALEEK
jgi:hypothetical protein